MEIANASLLDEATAAAEAMMLAKRVSKNRSDSFFVDKHNAWSIVSCIWLWQH